METYLTQIIDYLLTQSWQIAILVVLIAVLNFVLKNKSAHVRYLLWLIVLAKCLVPPFLTVPLAVLPEQRAVIVLPQTEPIVVEPVEAQVAKMPTPAPVIVKHTQRLTLQQWLAIGWIVGVVVFITVAVAKALRTELWLRRERKLLPAGLQGEIKELFVGLVVRIWPKLWLVEGIGQPFVWGVLRGGIYLPANFVKANNAEHRKGVIGHELSHILRLDAVINLLQIIAQAIFWFHPFVWWANKRIRAEREKCCDEIAIAWLGARAKEYSSAIVNILVSEHESIRPIPSLAVAGPVKNIEERIHTMLKPGKKFYKHPSLMASIVVLLIAVLTVPTALVLTARAEEVTITKSGIESTKSFETAIQANDLEAVKELIAQGADVNAEGATGCTPLLCAVDKGRVEIVKILLENGAKVNNVGDGWYTPLYYAVWNGDKEVVQTLVSKGADVNKKPKEGDYHPLVYAVWYHHPEIIKILIESGADVDAEDENGWTALRHALKRADTEIAKQFIGAGVEISDFHNTIFQGDLAKVKQFIEKGMDVNTPDKFGWTPIYWAVSAGQKEIAEYLLDQGADFDTKTKDGQTLLHQASRAGMMEIVKSLISKGVNVNVKCEAGMTPLQYAAGAGHEAVVRLLIASGAAVNVTSNNGRHPLGDAAVGGHEEIIKLLLASGAEVNLQPEDKMRCGTALHAAARGGQSTILDILIAHGANVNAAYKNGTPLHLAIVPTVGVQNGISERIVAKLLSRGANVNAKEPQRGWTPLHTAAAMGRFKIVEHLIADGADVNMRDDEGHTPLWYAEKKGHAKIVNVLRKHESLHDAAARGDIDKIRRFISEDVDIDVKTDRGLTPLHVACLQGRRYAARLLIDEGANINAKYKEGGTPLHLAAIAGHKETCELLISKGAEIDVRSGEFDADGTMDAGWTPLHAACSRGHKELAELLLAHGADVQAKTREGRTPLSLAEKNGHTEVVELLKNHGTKE